MIEIENQQIDNLAEPVTETPAIDLDNILSHLQVIQSNKAANIPTPMPVQAPQKKKGGCKGCGR